MRTRLILTPEYLGGDRRRLVGALDAKGREWYLYGPENMDGWPDDDLPIFPCLACGKDVDILTEKHWAGEAREGEYADDFCCHADPRCVVLRYPPSQSAP